MVDKTMMGDKCAELVRAVRSMMAEGLRPEDVKGKFENGILQISLPKAEQKKLPETTRIAIE